MVERHSLYPRTVFRIKRMILQARRSAVNAIYRVPKLKKGDPLPHLIHQVSTKLRPTEDPAEYRLTLGKIQNLRLAAKKLNGIVLPAGETFSFWSVLGRLTTWRGHVVGREIREGCLIPNVGVAFASCQTHFIRRHFKLAARLSSDTRIRSPFQGPMPDGTRTPPWLGTTLIYGFVRLRRCRSNAA